MLSKKLGQICKLRQGFQVPVDRQITECKEGYVRFIRIVDYTQKTDDIRYVLDDEKFYYVKPDDVVMVRYGAAGEVGHGISGVIANNMFLIDPVMDINKDYLFYYLSPAKVKNKLLSASSSTTMPALNFKIVNDLDIPIWSRESQDDIVKHLDKIKGIISKRREELTKLDELVKARFVEMFGDPVLNPFSWEMKRFDEICENLDSRRKPISSGDRVEGIYPYYGASGIVDYVEDYIFDEDILLVSEDGANLLMRSTPIAFSVSGKVWVNNHAHVVRFDKMSLQKYVEIYFSLIDISDSITGSAQPKLVSAHGDYKSPKALILLH